MFVRLTRVYHPVQSVPCPAPTAASPAASAPRIPPRPRPSAPAAAAARPRPLSLFVRGSTIDEAASMHDLRQEGGEAWAMARASSPAVQPGLHHSPLPSPICVMPSMVYLCLSVLLPALPAWWVDDWTGRLIDTVMRRRRENRSMTGAVVLLLGGRSVAATFGPDGRCLCGLMMGGTCEKSIN